MSDKHDLNLSVLNAIMRNCVKRAIAYNPHVAYETAKNDNINPRKNILQNKYTIPDMRPIPSCKTSTSKHLKKLIEAFEEIEQEFLSDLSTLKNKIKTDEEVLSQEFLSDLNTLKNKIKTDEEVLSQDICQNVFNKSCLSGCDKNASCEKQNSALSLKMTEKEDSSIASTDILEKYFTMCNTILSDEAQLLVNPKSIVESSEEEADTNDIQEKSSISEDSIPLVHNLTLILPRCNCATNSEQSGKVAKICNRRPEESNKKSEYIMISASTADICCNFIDVNNELPEENAMHYLKKEERESEEQLVYSDENICRRTSCCSCIAKKKLVECLCKECVHAPGRTAKEQLVNKILILIRQMYYMERSMLFIGLIDVISSIEENLAEFVILAEDTKHLLAPLNFLRRLIKLAKARSVLFYGCKKQQLGQACCVSTYISVISIRIGPSYFSEEIKNIKNMILNPVLENQA